MAVTICLSELCKKLELLFMTVTIHSEMKSSLCPLIFTTFWQGEISLTTILSAVRLLNKTFY